MPLESDPSENGDAVVSALGTITKRRNVASGVEVDARLLKRYALRSEARRLLPHMRCSVCGRFVTPGQDYVSVRYSAARDAATVRNVVMCGSLWTCPVCAARITEFRRTELERAMVMVKDRLKWQPVFITLTMRHRRHDELRELLSTLRLGWERLTRQRNGQYLRHSLGMLGYIRGLECTWGAANGWHPHIHWLAFFPPDVDVAAVESWIRERWGELMGRLGHAVNEHGVSVKATYGAVEDYLAKYGHEPALDRAWGVESELTKWHSKQGKQEGQDEHLTPFALLSYSLLGIEHAGRLFREFADCFFGQRQLYWSKGLRGLLLGSEAEPTDQEIVEQFGEDMPEVARLTPYQWRQIFGADLVGEFLVAVRACAGDAGGITAWLDSAQIERRRVGMAAYMVRSVRTSGGRPSAAVCESEGDPARSGGTGR